MKSNLIAAAVIAAMTVQSISSTAFAVSDAQRIAAANKAKMDQEKAMIVKSLSEMNRYLKKVKVQLNKEAHVVSNLDPSTVMGVTASVVALAASTYFLKGRQIINANSAVGYAGVLTLIANVTELTDKELGEASISSLNAKMEKTMMVLDEMQKLARTDEEKSILNQLSQDLNVFAQESSRQNNIQTKQNVFITGSVLMLFILAMKEAPRSSKDILVRNAVLAVSSALTVLSGLTQMDKALIEEKLNVAIGSLDSSIVLLSK